MKWPRVTVRPARLEEIPFLQQKLAEQKNYFEQHDLGKTICFVSDYGETPSGMVAGRLVWQIEPLMLFPDFVKNAPHLAQARATYLLVREIDRWIMGPENTTGIRQYFCFILRRRMQLLALAYGMTRVYWQRGAKMFGKNLTDPRIGKQE